MAEKGYVRTSVADVLRGAGVSRETFYQQFDSKQACFLAGFEVLRDRVIADVLAAPLRGARHERFGELLGRYLAAIAADPARARLYLIEIYAAGPEVLHRRLELQEGFVDGIATVFRARSVADRFACEALVAAIATLTTNALVEGGADAVLALRAPLVDIAARLFP